MDLTVEKTRSQTSLSTEVMKWVALCLTQIKGSLTLMYRSGLLMPFLGLKRELKGTMVCLLPSMGVLLQDCFSDVTNRIV